MPWSIWFLPIIVAVSFEQKKEAKYDLNLIFVQIYPKRPVKKIPNWLCCGYLWFSTYFCDFWGFILCLVNACICPCISSPKFLLGNSEYVFGRGNIFPFLTHAIGIFSLVTDFPILLLDTACSWCHGFFSNPELYLSARWVLGGPPCKLVTVMCMWHYSREEEKDENDTMIFRLDAQAWEGTSGFLNHAVTREGVFLGVTISSLWPASVLHLGHMPNSPADIHELKSLGSVWEDLSNDKPEDQTRWFKSCLYHQQRLQERVVCLWTGKGPMWSVINLSSI